MIGTHITTPANATPPPHLTTLHHCRQPRKLKKMVPEMQIVNGVIYIYLDLYATL